MNISLSPELQEFVNQKVKSGVFASANEVIQEGLRLLQQREQSDEETLEEVRREIALGLADLEAGKKERTSAREVLGEIRASAQTQKGS